MVRADAVLVVSLAAVAGQTAAVAPGPACLGALGVGAVLGRRVGLGVWPAALVAFALAAWRAGDALERFEAERVRVRDALGAPARCAASGTVALSPTRSGESLAFVADVDALECDEHR